MPVLSETDLAFQRFRAHREAATLFARSDPDLNEAETRAKLIDPLFRDVLGWNESEIRREQPAADGFSDYVFGGDYTRFHIEAKRVQPRFSLHAPSKARILQLSGPHLLANTSVKPLLLQAAKYAPDLGSEFAIVSNGDQFIVFRTHLPGRNWQTGKAIVFHDYDDIATRFAEFYELLNRDAVIAGSLLEAFDRSEAITANYHTPLEFIQTPDLELVRNRLWNQISKVFAPLLTDDPANAVLQEEIIRHCYVKTTLTDEADSAMDALLKDRPSQMLKDAGVRDMARGQGDTTAFDRAVEDDIKSSRPGTYVLTGGVGSGKTTYLRRYASIHDPGFVKRFCVWLHVDFLDLGNVASNEFDAKVRSHTYAKIRSIIRDRYPDSYPSTGEEIRALFQDQIAQLDLTTLFGVPKDSEKRTDSINTLVSSCWSNDELSTTAILRRVRRRGLRAVIVLDNTDQLGEKFQEAVFLFAQKVSSDLNALSVVAIREEKFFAAYRRGVFDAFGDRKFHIGSPNLTHVIRRRLEYGLSKLASQPEANTQEQRDVRQIVEAVIGSITRKNHNIVRMLACLSNGDMRHALSMFRAFISSGNTDTSKILRIIRQDGRYVVPFHEFAKSAILDARRYYRGSVTHVANVFHLSAARRPSYIAGTRVLARLSSAVGVSSRSGEGFVDTAQLLSEYRQSFGSADDFLQKCGDFLSHGLVESEPPKLYAVEKTVALKISASGSYYWRYLIRSFAYLDLVYVDTALDHRELARQLAHYSTSTDLSERFLRVRAFLDFIEMRERQELEMVTLHDGPYRSPLIPAIKQQIEDEIALIRRKSSG